MSTATTTLKPAAKLPGKEAASSPSRSSCC